MTKHEFLDTAIKDANAGQHPFPEYAACEAALESRYGTSGLAIKGNNLFGMKQKIHPVYPSVQMPTWEEVNGKNIQVMANFIKYPTWQHCFNDRISTLIHLRNVYHEYDAALKAIDGESFVRAVSARWSTDHLRAQKVIDIYNEYFGTK